MKRMVFSVINIDPGLRYKNTFFSEEMINYLKKEIVVFVEAKTLLLNSTKFMANMKQNLDSLKFFKNKKKHKIWSQKNTLKYKNSPLKKLKNCYSTVRYGKSFSPQKFPLKKKLSVNKI